jgi:glycosyltransferase involved in cell wall biosynthesis
MYKDDRRSMVQAVMFAVATLKMITRPFDLIDADHMPYLQLFPLRLVATLRRVPLVVSWNEWWGEQYWLTYLGQAGRVAASVERVGARTGDHIVALTSATAARLHAAGVAPERVSVQGLGVDRRAIEEAVPCAQAYDVVYVGRLIKHKGVDLLLSALAKLRQEGTTVTCGIAGEGPEEGRLRGQCTELGLDDVVTFIGALEARSEVFGLIKAARVFAYPTVREGYGLAVAEALACGTRVITVDHPDNHSQHLIVDEPLGLLCRPDADSFAAALHAILSQSPGPATGRSAVAARDWDDCADDLLQTYRAQVREK